MIVFPQFLVALMAVPTMEESKKDGSGHHDYWSTNFWVSLVSSMRFWNRVPWLENQAYLQRYRTLWHPIARERCVKACLLVQRRCWHLRSLGGGRSYPLMCSFSNAFNVSRLHVPKHTPHRIGSFSLIPSWVGRLDLSHPPLRDRRKDLGNDNCVWSHPWCRRLCHCRLLCVNQWRRSYFRWCRVDWGLRWHTCREKVIIDLWVIKKYLHAS